MRKTTFVKGRKYNVLCLDSSGRYIPSECIEVRPCHKFLIRGQEEKLDVISVVDDVECAESLKYSVFSDAEVE